MQANLVVLLIPINVTDIIDISKKLQWKNFILLLDERLYSILTHLNIHPKRVRNRYHTSVIRNLAPDWICELAKKEPVS